MSGIIRFLFVIGDFIFLNSSILLSFYLTNHFVLDLNDSNKVYLIIFSNLAWLFLIMVASPYNVTKGWSISKILRSQLAFILIHLIVVASLIVFYNKKYELIQIALIYVFFIFIFFAWKIVTFYIRHVATPEVPYKNYIIIGRNPVAVNMRQYYLTNRDLKYRFHGYFDLAPEKFNIEEIKDFCVEKEIHEILCCLELSKEGLQKLVAFGLDSLIKTKIITVSSSSSQTLSLDPSDKQPAIDFSLLPLDSTWNQFLKRSFDLIFSFLFLITTMSWLLPIAAILIKLDSRGPVFFLQPRSGRGNKPFNCLKFRTMKVNAQSDNLQATKDDARITKLGSFLRKTSIDEIPQFINVFMGDMSVVGPRPHMLKHTEEYRQLIEKFIGRQYIKPGITGLAQIMGYRGETKYLFEMKNRITLDLFYIENWSFGLDLKVIYLTVVSLLRGSDKAY
jgi:undecaprenyl-phosphate galactose phosphotransferase/putative colanic acid biosynthesis UDP-glucose lipid carrier transferase